MKLRAASLRLPRPAAFSGLTAAWLHGLDVEPCNPIEVVVPAPTTVSTRAGMVVRRCALGKKEVVTARGFPTTSALRTIRDLCLRLPFMEAVVITDMALHARLFSVSELTRSLEAGAGRAGIVAVRRVAEHVDPASESAMETRLRMLLVLGGLPRPEAQVTVRDSCFGVIGRLDLYYHAQRLGLEYDGATHRGTLAEDNRRQNRLLDAGIRLLRFTAGDIYNSPETVLGLVRAALAA